MSTIWKVHRLHRCPRFPLYLFFKKDASAIATSAMPENKVRRSAPGITSHHISRPRSKSPPAVFPSLQPESDRTLRLVWPILRAHPAGSPLLLPIKDDHD
jgi:hypothetical protein